VLDVCLKGVVEEVGSIVVVLRFWRVFKILEELGDAATEQMEGVGERLEVLERENAQLQMEVRELRRGKTQTLAGRSEEDVRNEL
jgi:regulator of replication initiation timing